MTDGDTLLSEDDWECSSATERDLLFSRLCDDDQLETIGVEFDIEWFEDHSVGYQTRDEARDQIVRELEDADELEQALDLVDPDPYSFDWFYGWHYVVDVEQSSTVNQGPARTQWQEIAEEVQQQTAGNETLIAFLRGILGGDGSGDVLRVDFSEAEARGSQYVDDGRLSATHLATEPGLITGITTRKGSNSGRSYRVARELVPVITAALDQQVESKSAPVETPEQQVPDEIGRRIPKFQEVLDAVELTSADISQFESILDEHEALEYWKDYVAPTVKFRPQAKKAILCMLASPDDTEGTKGRTNAIIYGPPGTGKTAFKNFLVDEFGAYSIDGARVSKVDLTYNKNTDEDGLLVRAHKGLAVIEEADELDQEALGAALTALGESGQIEIRDMRLPAEVRGVMLGNYRSRDEIIAKHSEALFNRFEFVLEFDRLDDTERDEAIDWQYDHFRQATRPEQTEQLKKFIAWVRDFDPALLDDERERIKRYKRKRIENVENVRKGIAVLNVAYTIARLNHRDVTLEDYKRAFDLTIDT